MVNTYELKNKNYNLKYFVGYGSVRKIQMFSSIFESNTPSLVRFGSIIEWFITSLIVNNI